MKIANTEVRESITSKGLKYWEVAREVGISATTFTVWLREPLTEEKKNRVLKAIEKAKKLN